MMPNQGPNNSGLFKGYPCEDDPDYSSAIPGLKRDNVAQNQAIVAALPAIFGAQSPSTPSSSPTDTSPQSSAQSSAPTSTGPGIPKQYAPQGGKYKIVSTVYAGDSKGAPLVYVANPKAYLHTLLRIQADQFEIQRGL